MIKTLDTHFFQLFVDLNSLFTNVPLGIAIESVSNRWTYLENKCNILKDEFLKALNLVLDSTYFQFDNCFFKRMFGIPMGSTFSDLGRLSLIRPRNFCFKRNRHYFAFFQICVLTAISSDKVEEIKKIFPFYIHSILESNSHLNLKEIRSIF